MAGKRGICSCDCIGEVSEVKGQQNQVLWGIFLFDLGTEFFLGPYAIFSSVFALVWSFRDTSHTESRTAHMTSVYLHLLLKGPIDMIAILYLLVLHVLIQSSEV